MNVSFLGVFFLFQGILFAKQLDEKYKISQTVQQSVQSATAGARQGYNEVADGAKEVVHGAQEMARGLDETMRITETVGTMTTAFSQEGKVVLYMWYIFPVLFVLISWYLYFQQAFLAVRASKIGERSFTTGFQNKLYYKTVENGADVSVKIIKWINAFWCRCYFGRWHHQT